MKKWNTILSMGLIALVCSCGESEPKVEAPVEKVITEDVHPQEMLKEAYQLFKEGKDEESIILAKEVLELGRSTDNDTLVGGALTSLCRNAQRSLDTNSLADLSDQLVALSDKSGNPKWMMYRAHMNAEMWRLIGDMDRAESFYNESMEISSQIGALGMFTIDHFNKSFVSVAKGDFETAQTLILKYYALRNESDPESEDAYGLIAMAYYLEQQENYEGAHQVAVVTRRLFEEQNLFPEPPDEKPLLAVEAKVDEKLSSQDQQNIELASDTLSVSDLLEKYMQ